MPNDRKSAHEPRLTLRDAVGRDHDKFPCQVVASISHEQAIALLHRENERLRIENERLRLYLAALTSTGRDDATVIENSLDGYIVVARNTDGDVIASVKMPIGSVQEVL